MTDFRSRLKQAIDRGNARQNRRHEAERKKAMTEEEFKSLHSRYRLQISEHIEQNLQQLADSFPGFKYETTFGDRGWGAACSRDDFASGRGGRRSNKYSRLEVAVRPYSDLHVLELVAKGTVQNREIFNRTFFEELADADPARFLDLVDAWVVEFAELFAANR